MKLWLFFSPFQLQRAPRSRQHKLHTPLIDYEEAQLLNLCRGIQVHILDLEELFYQDAWK